jgi:hypothetical protein
MLWSQRDERMALVCCAVAPGCRQRHLLGALDVILKCVANRHDLNIFVEQHEVMLQRKERDSLLVVLAFILKKMQRVSDVDH